ncbi:unnamed protein product [Cuscuta europaea]|nr:unnamed protein product [Cuscuta europaea]
MQQNPNANNRKAPKTTQSIDRSDQNDGNAKRRVEDERDGGGSLEYRTTKSKSMGNQEEERHTRTPAAAAATMTEVAAGHSVADAAAAYLEGAKKLIRTHRRELLNVAVGLAILGISMYVVTGRGRHD